MITPKSLTDGELEISWELRRISGCCWSFSIEWPPIQPEPDEFGFGRVKFESTLTAPLDDVLQTGLQGCHRPFNFVYPQVIVQLGVIGVEMHLDTVFLDDVSMSAL